MFIKLNVKPSKNPDYNFRPTWLCTTRIRRIRSNDLDDTECFFSYEEDGSGNVGYLCADYTADQLAHLVNIIEQNPSAAIPDNVGIEWYDKINQFKVIMDCPSHWKHIAK